MADRLGVLIADDSEQVRQSIRAMLGLDEGFVVLGEAADGQTAVELTRTLRPDVVLMDVNMPVLDGIAATAAITASGVGAGVVIISVQGEPEYLRRAMQAGARDYLIKPFTYEELVSAARRAAGRAGGAPEQPGHKRPRGQVVTLVSARGGVGKSLLACNLAASLALKTRLPVAAVDLDLEFGVLHSFLGVRAAATWLDVCRVEEALTPEHLQRALTRGGVPGLGLLAAPPSPHQAAEVDGEGRAEPARNYVAEALEALRREHDYVVVDTGRGLRESVLTALDLSDRILVVSVPEIPALQNTARLLEILVGRLGYPRERVDLVLNMTGMAEGPGREEIERSLGYPVVHELPWDPASASWAANAGQLLVTRRARGPLSEAIGALAHRLIAGGTDSAMAAAAHTPPATAGPQADRGSGLGRRMLELFGLGLGR